MTIIAVDNPVMQAEFKHQRRVMSTSPQRVALDSPGNTDAGSGAAGFCRNDCRSTTWC